MENPVVYLEFNKNTSKYTEITSFLKDHAHLLEWKPEEVVLDLGCGPGDVTACVLQQWLPADFRYLLGVDASDKMIEFAHASNTNEKLEFKTVDICLDKSELIKTGKYADGFDKLFSFYVLHWLEDLERGLRTMYQILKPGGQSLVTFPVNLYFHKIFKQVCAKERWCGYFKNVKRDLPVFLKTTNPAKEFRSMLETAGFQVSLCSVTNTEFHIESVDIFYGLTESLDPYIDCVPVQMKIEYLDDCFQAMKAIGFVREETNKSVTRTLTMLTCAFKRPSLCRISARDETVELLFQKF